MDNINRRSIALQRSSNRYTDHSKILVNHFSSDFSSLDVRYSKNQTISSQTQTENQNNPTKIQSSSPFSFSSSAFSSSSNSSLVPLPKTSFIQYTNVNYIGRNRVEDLPEKQQVTKLEHTHVNVKPIQQNNTNVAAQTRDKIHSTDEYNMNSGDHHRMNSTTTIASMNTTKIEAIQSQHTETFASTIAKIGSKQTIFSRDRLFHANVSSIAHDFLDFLKFSRSNSESNILNCSSSNRKNSTKNSCLVAAMRLNVPDYTSVAITEPSVSVSMPIDHIDDNVVNIVSTNSNNLVISNGNENPLTIAQMKTPTSSSTISSSSSHVFENGTVLEKIVTQPSITIQVNQNENHCQQSHLMKVTQIHIELKKLISITVNINEFILDGIVEAYL